jgi:chemotaxis protein CheX
MSQIKLLLRYIERSDGMLRAGLINPFLESAYNFLKNELSTEVTRGQLRLEESRATSGEVNVAIGVTGDAEGIVIYSMSERTAKTVASALIGESVPVFDQLAESAIAEMGNIITGQAAIGLEECGYLCKLSPPTLISGKGVVISTLDIQRLIIPLELPLGYFEICVALRYVARK